MNRATVAGNQPDPNSENDATPELRLEVRPPATPTSTPTATPTPTPTPAEARCRVTLTLVSIEVTLDTEEADIDEWEIHTGARAGPFGRLLFATTTVQADGGQGAVAINQVVGSDSVPKRRFPLRGAPLSVRLYELDEGPSERPPSEFGRSDVTDDITLSCPGSVEVSLEVTGRGLDRPDPQPVEFRVTLLYRWDVVEQ